MAESIWYTADLVTPEDAAAEQAALRELRGSLDDLKTTQAAEAPANVDEERIAISIAEYYEEEEDSEAEEDARVRAEREQIARDLEATCSRRDHLPSSRPKAAVGLPCHRDFARSRKLKS